MWVTKQLLVHIDFYRKKNILWILKTYYYWISNYLVTNIIQKNIYVQQKKETHSGLILNSSE